MRDIVQMLIKDYYGKSMIIKDMVIQEQRGKQIINIFDNLAPLKWRLFEPGSTDINTGIGKPDVEASKTLIEELKMTRALQLFHMTKDILISEGKEKEFNALWKNTIPKGEIGESHTLLMTYSQRALFFLKVITPYEYDTTQDIIDESGIEIGTKLLPKETENILDEIEKGKIGD